LGSFAADDKRKPPAVFRPGRRNPAPAFAFLHRPRPLGPFTTRGERAVHNIFYLIGVVVVIIVVLSLAGLI
jgi:hypothetical protein